MWDNLQFDGVCSYARHLLFISFRKDLCFTADVLKILFIQREIFEMRWPIGMKFCTVISSKPSFVTPIQNFWRASPKKFLGPKNMQNLARFRTTLSSAANIFGTDIHNWTSILFTSISPALVEKSLVNFGPLVTEILMWNHTHPPKSTFSKKNYILAPKGCCTLKFLHALENHSLTSAPPMEMGSPLQFFSKGGSKLA